MRYLTARKRAEGLGRRRLRNRASLVHENVGRGSRAHHPVFLVAFGRALGGSRAEVLDAFSHPAMAILTGLVIFFGLRHFAAGAQTMIEDYAHGSTRRALVIFVTILSYGLIATGLFALAKIAL